MKRLVSIFVIFVLFAAGVNFTASASRGGREFNTTGGQIQLLRAGGGDSGGGGGGSGGGSSGGGISDGGSSANSRSTMRNSVFSDVLFLACIVSFSCGTAIIFRYRLFKYERKTRKIINSLQKKDRAWDYQELRRRAEDTYFVIQKAWTNFDLPSARDHMSKELYDSFNTKLAWMEYRKERNVLKNIKLLKAVPVSVCSNDDSAHVWFYIKGRIVDYKIDTQTNERISGSTMAESFVEYWQFIRSEKGGWVLNKILQKDEANKIAFPA